MDFKDPLKNRLKKNRHFIQLVFTYFKWSFVGESRALDKYRLGERWSHKDNWACFTMGSVWKPNNLHFTLMEKLKMKWCYYQLGKVISLSGYWNWIPACETLTANQEWDAIYIKKFWRKE